MEANFFPFLNFGLSDSLDFTLALFVLCFVKSIILWIIIKPFSGLISHTYNSPVFLSYFSHIVPFRLILLSVLTIPPKKEKEDNTSASPIDNPSSSSPNDNSSPSNDNFTPNNDNMSSPVVSPKITPAPTSATPLPSSSAVPLPSSSLTPLPPSPSISTPVSSSSAVPSPSQTPAGSVSPSQTPAGSVSPPLPSPATETQFSIITSILTATGSSSGTPTASNTPGIEIPQG